MNIRHGILLCILLALLYSPGRVSAQGDTSIESVAGLVMKLMAFEKNVSKLSDGVTIFVLNQPEMAKELRRHIGLKIGNTRLKRVDEGRVLPAQPPDIVYIGNEVDILPVIRFVKKHNLVSVTSTVRLLDQGVALAIDPVTNGNPKIYVNMAASLACGLDWKPALIKGAVNAR